jgi:cobyrinic acid a,c-diamide synthase
LRGFTSHQPSVPLAGVIFNRISSGRHAALLASAAARHLPGLACLGTLPADPGLVLPSRHLGLVPAGENRDADAIIERCADRIGDTADVERLLSLARPSKLTTAVDTIPVSPLGQRVAVAIRLCSTAGEGGAPNSLFSRRSRTSRRPPRPMPSTCRAATPSFGRSGSHRLRSS